MDRRRFVLSSLALAGMVSCSRTQAPQMASRGQLNGIVPVTAGSSRVRIELAWPGHIDGAAVAFDTGTSGNAIDMDFFRQAGLRRTGDALVTDGGTGQPIEAFETTIPGATFGGYPVGDLVASVYDYQPRDEVGIVGPNVFWKQFVFLEFGLNRLRIRQRTPEVMPADTPFPYHDLDVPNSTPALTVSLPNGETVAGTLDSGANAELLLPMRFMDTLPLIGGTRGGRQTSAGSTSAVHRATIDGRVQVGPVVLDSPRVVFFGGQHASAGMPILRRLRILLDPEGHRWWTLGPRVLPLAHAERLRGVFGSLRIEPDETGRLDATLGGQTRKLVWHGANQFVADSGDSWTDRFSEARTIFDFHGPIEAPAAVEVIRTTGAIELFKRH